MPVSVTDLESALRTNLKIEHLEIIDTSNGCGQNYSIVVVAQDFDGKLTLARHRLVNEVIKEQIANMHAFSQKTYTPKQWKAELEKRKAEEEAEKAKLAEEAEKPEPIAV